MLNNNLRGAIILSLEMVEEKNNYRENGQLKNISLG